MRTCYVTIVVCLMSILTAAQCKPEVKKEIDEVRSTWLKDWKAKDLKGVMSLYAPNATLLPSDGSRIVGKEDIRARFAKEIGTTTVDADTVNVDCSHDLAYDSGRYTSEVSGGTTLLPPSNVLPNTTILAGGGKKNEGKYLVVLKHVAGKWLIVQHASTLMP